MGQTGLEIQFHYEERTTNVPVEWEELNLWSWGRSQTEAMVWAGSLFRRNKAGPPESPAAGHFFLYPSELEANALLLLVELLVEKEDEEVDIDFSSVE